VNRFESPCVRNYPPIRLSFAILTHNEQIEFVWLMDALAPILDDTCEIVVLDDFSRPEVVDAIRRYNVRFHQRALQRNFSAQRNHLKSMCRGEFIFVVDPDEIPSPHLLRGLPAVLDAMRREDIDACALPRLNILVESPHPVHVNTLALTNGDLQAAPRDDQMRLIRNRPEILWINHVHERLVGVKRCYRFPQDLRYALFHCKTLSRARAQNRFYRRIPSRYIDKFRKSLAKRFGALDRIDWVEIPCPI